MALAKADWMDLAYILDLIRQHGPGIIFAFAASHSMIAALLAGYLAQSGALDLTNALLLCWTGSFAGDAVRFWIGRRYGLSWFNSFPRIEAGLKKAGRLVDQHYVLLLLIHRYPLGIRNAAAFAFGISNMSWPFFFSLNFISAGLWAGLTVFAGYTFFHIAEKTMDDTASKVGLALLIVFVAAIWLLGRRLERALERS
jgi:membrane protein DedA with SNARE-associated domain